MVKIDLDQVIKQIITFGKNLEFFHEGAKIGNTIYKKKVISPLELIEQMPINYKQKQVLEEKKTLLNNIFHINPEISNKYKDYFTVFMGPCSVDNVDSQHKYLDEMQKLSEEVIKDKVLIVVRNYFGKPRTLGVGFKGGYQRPNPNGSVDYNAGLKMMRGMHLDTLNRSLVSIDEMLNPENEMYLYGSLDYKKIILGSVAIGARSTTNQGHKEYASGLDCSVAVKNNEAGNLLDLVQTVIAVQSPMSQLRHGYHVQTLGNQSGYCLLRGEKVDKRKNPNTEQSHLSNYDEATMNYLIETYQKEIKGSRVPEGSEVKIVIDANHCNSGKKYMKQIDIIHEVLEIKAKTQNSYLERALKGVMFESNIFDGTQKIQSDGSYTKGLSLTDPCLGLEKSIELVKYVAANHMLKN